MDKKYGSYTNEDINDWQSLPANSSVLTSSAFGAWLMRRDERKGNRDLINELEKIKTEISKCSDYIITNHNNTEADMNKLDGIILATTIIDAEIAELKGENK